MDVTGEAKQREHGRSREDRSERGNESWAVPSPVHLGDGGRHVFICKNLQKC